MYKVQYKSQKRLIRQGLKRYARLEGGGMVASGSSHRNCSFLYRNLQQPLHLSARPKNLGQLSGQRLIFRQMKISRAH